MFNKDKWLNMNLSEYRDKMNERKKEDFSIINIINFEKIKKVTIIGDSIKGIPFAVKDNYALDGTITTAASEIFKDFKPLYTATIYIKLMQHGGIPIFKTNLDELAMGGTGLTSNYGPVYNPFHKGHISGGSSSGSAYLVADKTVPFSIGSDTGDSVRKPAAYTGIVGFKPTWGLVSRYGLYDFAPTWDTVSWFTNTIKESAVLLDILQGYDEKDNSSIKSEEKDFLKNIELTTKYKIITIPILEKYIQDEVILIDYKKTIELLKKDGHKIIEVKNFNIEILSTILTVYKIISSTEAFSCNSNLTGFIFGSGFKNGKNFEEKITISRTKGFNYEVKKRMLFAQEVKYSNNQEYLKSIKMRRLINNEINRILLMGDVLLIPTTPNLSDDINAMNKFKSDNLLNNFLTLFNCNGSPSISLPVTKNGHLSTSVNISSLPFNDKKVLKLANRLEEIL